MIIRAARFRLEGVSVNTTPIRFPRRVHAAAPRGGRRGVSFWAGHYLPQHLAAGAATLVGSALLAQATHNLALVGLGTALLESAVFYAVALYRDQRAGAPLRARSAALMREYGLSEVQDLLLRPALIATGLCLVPLAAAGAVLGSWLADLAFYGSAARRRAALAEN